MKVYVIEDDSAYGSFIKSTIQYYLKTHTELSSCEILTIHDSYKDFISSIRGETSITNIYFIDIELTPQLNGLQLAQKIREFDYNSYIIFLTAHIELATATYQYNLKALTFIYKGNPLLKQRITSALDQICLEQFTRITASSPEISTSSQLIYSYNSHHYKIQFNSIYYIETHPIKRCLLVHTNNKHYEYPGALNQLLNKLPITFVKCHKSYIVNITHIQEIQYQDNHYKVIINDENHCFATKKYLSNVLQAMKTYA